MAERAPETALAPDGPADAPAAPAKRPRGRPRKIRTEAELAPKIPAKRGRKPKSATLAEQNGGAAPKPEPAPAASTAGPQAKAENGKADQGAAEQAILMPDFTALSQNFAVLVDKGAQAAAAYFKPLEEGRTNSDIAEHVEDAVKTLGHVAEHRLSDPGRAFGAQTRISGAIMELW